MSKENHLSARSRKRGPNNFCSKHELRNIIGKLYDMLIRQQNLRRIAEARVTKLEKELAAAKSEIAKLVRCQKSSAFNVATSVQTVIIPTTTNSTQTQCRINDRNKSQQVSKNMSDGPPRNPLVSTSPQQKNLEQWEKDLLKMPSEVQKYYNKRAYDYAAQKLFGKTIPPVGWIMEGLINSWVAVLADE